MTWFNSEVFGGVLSNSLFFWYSMWLIARLSGDERASARILLHSDWKNLAGLDVRIVPGLGQNDLTSGSRSRFIPFIALGVNHRQCWMFRSFRVAHKEIITTFVKSQVSLSHGMIGITCWFSSYDRRKTFFAIPISKPRVKQPCWNCYLIATLDRSERGEICGVE